MDEIHFFLFVEDQIGELLVPVYEDEPIIIIGRAVVWLALTDAGKTSVDILVRNVVFYAEIPIIEAKLPEANTANWLGGFIILNMCFITNEFFIDTFEFWLP